jgi:quercetin dioxygenase-like cupin family protein
MAKGKPTEGRPAAGQVVLLADLVDYQGGCVVSRTLAKTEHGSVTVFAFDQGQSLSEHTVPFDALIHLLDGEAEITISGNAHRLKQGQMIVMPANEPHAVKAPARFKMVLTILR